MLVVVFNLRPRPRFEVLRGIVRGCELIAAIGPLTEPPSPVRQAVAFFVATVAGITFTERFEEHALIISLTLVVHVLAIVFVAAPEGVTEKWKGIRVSAQAVCVTVCWCLSYCVVKWQHDLRHVRDDDEDGESESEGRKGGEGGEGGEDKGGDGNVRRLAGSQQGDRDESRPAVASVVSDRRARARPATAVAGGSGGVARVVSRQAWRCRSIVAYVAFMGPNMLLFNFYGGVDLGILPVFLVTVLAYCPSLRPRTRWVVKGFNGFGVVLCFSLALKLHVDASPIFTWNQNQVQYNILDTLGIDVRRTPIFSSIFPYRTRDR